jgi:phosphotransferase system HPr (HPr) family protein
VNKLGLHARASAKLTQTAGRFASSVFLSRNGKRVNAKSIMGVMMLAAGKGSSIDAQTEGAFLGFIGQPRVNVLMTNRALDARFGAEG